MSGASIAYHLRSHKAVDRRLFVELLSRYERERSLFNAAYISMGAYSLEDQRLIHKHIGISKLISFDIDEKVVSRQEFNRPTEACVCLKKSSGELIEDLESVLASHDCANATSVIVWLDYTDPKQIGSQIREFESLLNKLREGDFVRITINANPKFLQDPNETGAVLITKAMQNQFDFIRESIGDYLPSTAKPECMTTEGLAILLSQAFGSAALKALPLSGRNVFIPLSVVRYADTTQMLSMSGAIVARDRVSQVRSRMGLEDWPFTSSDWSDVKNLVVPAITLRERLFLERSIMNKSDAEVEAELGFSYLGETNIKNFLESYKKYYRFYPTFLPAEI